MNMILKSFSFGKFMAPRYFVCKCEEFVRTVPQNCAPLNLSFCILLIAHETTVGHNSLIHSCKGERKSLTYP